MSEDHSAPATETVSHSFWSWLGRVLGYGLLGTLLYGLWLVGYERIAGEAPVVVHEPVLTFSYPGLRWWLPSAGCALVPHTN